MESKSHNKEYFFLIVILISAFIVRLIFMRYDYLYGVDPYYHYSNFEGLVESGHHLLPLGLYSPALFIKSFLGIFGISSYDSFRLSVPIFGVSTIFIIYLVAKEIFDNRVALVSSAILAFTPIFIIRTIASNYRGDPFSMFFMALAFYFFIVSLKKYGNDKPWSISLSLMGGFSMAISGAVWTSGYIFSAVILTGFLFFVSILAFVKNEENRSNIIIYLILVGSSIVILFSLDFFGILQLGIQNISGFRDFSILIFPIAVIVPALLEFARPIWGKLGDRNRLYLILVSGSLLLAVILLINPDLLGNILNLYKGHYISKVGSYSTTSELTPFSLPLYLDKFKIVSLIFPVGLVFFLWNRKFSNQNIFLLLWLLGALYVMVKIGQRGTFIASIPISIFAGYGIVFLYDKVNEFMGPSRYIYSKVSAGIISILLIAIAIQGVQLSLEIKPLINDNWYDGLSWQKENLPEDSNVLSWWSYGHWISGIGGGKSFVNPGQNQEKINGVADIFFEDDKQRVEEYLSMNGIDYIIVSSDFIGIIPVINEIRNSKEPSYVVLLPQGTDDIKGEQLDNFGDILLVKTFDNGERSGVVSKDQMYLAKVYYHNKGIIQQNDPYSINRPVDESGSFYLSYGDFLISEIKIDELYYRNMDTYSIFIPRELDNILLTSLLFKDGIDFEGLFSLEYSNMQVKIFKVNYSD